MTNLLACLAVLTAYILVYNFAIYAFARQFGIRVEEFYVWYKLGRFRLLRFRLGHTEFGWGWLPLGGYVKLAGMVPDWIDRTTQPHDYLARTLGQKLTTTFAGPFSSLLIGLAIAWLTGYTDFYTVGKIMLYLLLCALLFAGIGRGLALLLPAQRPLLFSNVKIWGLYFLLWLAYSILLFGFLNGLNSLIPVFSTLWQILTGDQSTYSIISRMNTEKLPVLYSYLGIFFFATNLIPLGALIGGSMLRDIFLELTGVDTMDSKMEAIYQLTTLPVLALWGFFLYKFFF